MTQDQLIAQAVAAVLAQNGVGSKATKSTARRTKVKAKGGRREKLSDADKDAFKMKNDAECVKAFKAKGFDDVVPRVNVMTYGKVKDDGTKTGWLSVGRKVKKGEKATKVGPFALFHVSQTEEIGAGEQVAA